MSRIGVFIGISLVATLASCGDVERDTSVAQEELTGNFGEVLFSYRQSFTELTDEGPAPFQVSARFVRVRELGWHEVRDLWGDELPLSWGDELPLTDDPSEECRAFDTVVPRQDDFLSGSLELLDAGELSLTIGDEELRVPRQSFPSVFGFAAGVEYEGEALDMDFLPEREYRLLSNGSEEISAFNLALVAPDEFEALAVGGAEVAVETPVVESSGQGLEVRWEPGISSSEIFLELSIMNQFGFEQRIVCHSQEDGAIDIPPSLTSRFLEAGVSDARLVIYRVARTVFSVEGLDEAEVLFVVSAIVPLNIP